MKTKIYFTILILLISGIINYAQQTEINEEKVLINKKLVDAWVAVINEDIDLVRKSFIRFTKDKYNLNAKRKSEKSVLIEQADIPSIISKKGDVWLIFLPEGRNIKMGIAFFLGYDIVLNSTEYPNEMAAFKDFTREFIVYYKTEYFNTLISENARRLKSLKKELKRSSKEIKVLSKQVSRAEKEILKTSDEKVKFELGNINIETKAKIQASHEIVTNLKEEISKVTKAIKEIKSSLRKLEMEVFEEETLED